MLRSCSKTVNMKSCFPILWQVGFLCGSVVALGRVPTRSFTPSPIQLVWGVGIDNDIIAASIKALVSAVNRAIQQRQK